jgi:hypothetical protein
MHRCQHSFKKNPSNLWVVHVGSNSFLEISYAGKPQVVSRYILSNLWRVPTFCYHLKNTQFIQTIDRLMIVPTPSKQARKSVDVCSKTIHQEFNLWWDWRKRSQWDKKSFFMFVSIWWLSLAVIGRPMGRMSGCCLVNRWITLKLVQVKVLKNSGNTTAPICGTSLVPHT